MAIKRGFQDTLEMDTHIIKMWNSVVKKNDTTWILGDITMEDYRSYSILDRLNGSKKVVLGNHDMPKHVPKLLKFVNEVCAFYRLKGGIALSHIPIHESEMNRFKANIHGHLHELHLPDKRYINVSAEVIDYTPKLLTELL